MTEYFYELSCILVVVILTFYGYISEGGCKCNLVMILDFDCNY